MKSRKSAGILPKGTAADVAREMGISVFTVSRAFSGSPVVTSLTRTRIFETACRLGYRREAAMRLMSSPQVLRVAVARSENIIRGQIYQEILAGLEMGLSQGGASIVLPGSADAEDTAAWLKGLVRDHQCEGLFLLLEDYPPELSQILAQLHVPLIFLYHRPAKEAVPAAGSVIYDTGDGIAQAVRHLADIGHRAIAYFGIPRVLSEDRLRESAFRTAMKTEGLPLREEWVVPHQAQQDLPPGAAAFDLIFSRPGDKPTAIVCGSDAAAMGALSCARRWNRTVPGDVSITGFDDNFWLSFYTPALTSVRQSGWELGQSAASLFLGHRAAPTEPLPNISLPTRLIVRGSTAPPTR